MKVTWERGDIWAGRRFSLYRGTPQQTDFIIGYHQALPLCRTVYGIIDLRDGMLVETGENYQSVADYLNSDGRFVPSELLTTK
jgi:hypothetical protein